MGRPVSGAHIPDGCGPGENDVSYPVVLRAGGPGENDVSYPVVRATQSDSTQSGRPPLVGENEVSDSLFEFDNDRSWGEGRRISDSQFP
jgi:hypothetical protein